MKIIDLTCPLNNHMPLHPIAKDIEIIRKYTLENDGYNITQIKIFTHSGTHIDAPFHMIKNGKKLDEIPLENFFGNAAVLNVPKGELGEITSKELEEALGKSKLKVYPGETVLINTGWGKYYVEEIKDSIYLAEKHPGLLMDAAEWFIEKIKLIGIDVFSIRHPKLPPKVTVLNLKEYIRLFQVITYLLLNN
ncbi:MAG: cyclase family protein [Candidatus Methanomethylicaceae archaeon]